jgi:Chaperone of endosialidase
MKAYKFMQPLALSAAALLFQRGQAQVSVANNSPSTGDFVGCDAGTTIPLEIRHDAGDQQIELYSTGDANPEVFLSPTLTGVDYGGYYPFTFDVTGNLGVGTGFSMTYPPLTKLHIGQNSTNPTGGFRDWMQSGLLNTQSTDGMYVGLKDEGGSGQNDAIINWSDNRLSVPDALRFIFTAGLNGLSSMGTSEGLELARILPDPAGNWGYFGIGDFASGAVEPTERLDVLDGRVRIRKLPFDTEAPNLTKVLVVDDSGDPVEDGVIKWREASGLFQCDWVVQPDFDVSTAYNGLTSPCPTEVNNVGIGIKDPEAMVDVYKEVSEGTGTDIGVRSVVRIEDGIKHAISATTDAPGSENVGVIVASDNAERNWGVVSFTGSGGTGTGVVSGFFQADREGHTGDAIGVWGRVTNMSSAGTDWAGFFEGQGYLSNGPWVLSDQNLKTDIQDVPGSSAMGRIMALSPKSYHFTVEEHPGMGMPDGLQYGLLAQEVQEIYPELVTDVNRPAVVGPDGEVQEEAISFKAMKYEGLIADLIGAVKHQQAMIDELQEQVAACCSSGSDNRTPMVPTAVANGPLETDLRIIPNPVADQTELRYTLAEAGRVRLEITDQSGRVVLTKEEGQREASAYMYQWDTTALSPGTYNCALYVNDEQVVRKAVKLAVR